MSAEPNIDHLYEQHIKALPRAAKLRLLGRITEGLIEAEETIPSFSALDLLAQTPGGRAFTTAGEVAAYLAQERDTWDR